MPVDNTDDEIARDDKNLHHVDVSDDDINREQQEFLEAPVEQPGDPIEPSEMTEKDHPPKQDNLSPAAKRIKARNDAIHDLLDIDVEQKDEIHEIEQSPRHVNADDIKRVATVNLSSSFRTYDNDFL